MKKILGSLNLNTILWVMIPAMVVTPLYSYHMAVSKGQQPPYPHATITDTATHYPQDISFRYVMLFNSSFLALAFYIVFRWIQNQAKKVGFRQPPKYQFYLAEGSIACYGITIGTIDEKGIGNLHTPCAIIFFIVWLITIVNMTVFMTKMRQWDTSTIGKSSLLIKQILSIYIVGLGVFTIFIWNKAHNPISKTYMSLLLNGTQCQQTCFGYLAWFLNGNISNQVWWGKNDMINKYPNFHSFINNISLTQIIPVYGSLSSDFSIYGNQTEEGAKDITQLLYQSVDTRRFSQVLVWEGLAQMLFLGKVAMDLDTLILLTQVFIKFQLWVHPLFQFRAEFLKVNNRFGAQWPFLTSSVTILVFYLHLVLANYYYFKSCMSLNHFSSQSFPYLEINRIIWANIFTNPFQFDLFLISLLQSYFKTVSFIILYFSLSSFLFSYATFK